MVACVEAVASCNVDVEYVVSRRKWVGQRNVERLSLEISCGDTRAFLKIMKGRGLMLNIRQLLRLYHKPAFKGIFPCVITI
jgi:hypothetical protein